jgi:hypothetical protein
MLGRGSKVVFGKGKQKIPWNKGRSWTEKEKVMISEGTKIGMAKPGVKNKIEPTQFKKGVKPNYTPFVKGHKIRIGMKQTKESIQKIKDNMPNFGSDSIVTHHIWYEDNNGNPTEKGIMKTTRKHHPELHAVLRHNYWTDNRRCLAG